MKRVCFTYALDLRFSSLISRHTFLFRFHPRSDSRQQLWGLETTCDPASSMPLGRDSFGNLCFCGHVEHAHDHLSLRVRGDALLENHPLAEKCPGILAYPTALTMPNDELSAIGQDLKGDNFQKAMTASERLREYVAYEKGVTDDHTTASQAFEQGVGVCQDMAHMLLAILRSQRIPARYVAGLIPGEGETHAWVEVWNDSAFIGVDPTNLCPADDRYLAVNRGRDSQDCAINRGVFVGFASQEMIVSARMAQC